MCVLTLCLIVVTGGDAIGLRTSKPWENEVTFHINSLTLLLTLFHVYMNILFACLLAAATLLTYSRNIIGYPTTVT